MVNETALTGSSGQARCLNQGQVPGKERPGLVDAATTLADNCLIEAAALPPISAGKDGDGPVRGSPNRRSRESRRSRRRGDEYY